MRAVPNLEELQLAPGSRLDDRYELLYPYAQGGMAVVWVARVRGKHGFEKLVAVKVILSELANDENFRKMFLDEARIASGVRHPNVAQVEDLGDEGGTLYMVLEWVGGDSLSALQKSVQKRGETFPVDLLLRIVADACAGLHAAHELAGPDGSRLKVVHRDVSPQNILVSSSGMVKVIDFGVAKARDRLAEKTRTGLFKGKAIYAAPEQVRTRKADRRSDLYALGVILYQFLAGRLPFDAKNDMDALRRLAADAPPPPPPPLPPHVPPAVAAIVTRALQPDPDARYQTALDMQRDLEGALSRPTTPADVATFVQDHLASQLEQQRSDLVEALSEAARRDGASAEPSPLLAAALARPPMRGGVSEETDATTIQRPVPVLRGSHWAMMGIAVVVTFTVWSAVLLVLSGALRPAPAPYAPPPALTR